MKQCVYCLVPISKKNGTQSKDHVIPKSWSVEPLKNITVPSCYSCNNKFGLIEEKFRQLYFLTGNSSNLIKFDIYSKASSSLGLDDKNNYKKKLIRKKILSLIEPYDPLKHKSIILGLENEKKYIVNVSELYESLFTKIFIGLEYAKTSRLIDVKKQFKIYILPEGKNDLSVDLSLQKFGQSNIVCGVLKIIRGEAVNDKNNECLVLYKAILWDKIIVYCSIDF